MKFKNITKAPQGLYLPSICGPLMHTERTFVAVDQFIEVYDDGDIELLRRLCGKGSFVEIDPPEDPPESKPAPKLCANARCRAVLEESPQSPFCSEDCRLENIRRSIATRATRE